MRRVTEVLVFLVTLLSGAVAQQVSSGSAGYNTTFKASNGDVIELDTRTGVLKTPRSRSADLEDCSDKFQICLTDHHGFAFAYFRRCGDMAYGDLKRLSFRPIFLSALHNNVWMVFDASPNYLFQYSDSKGIVGIYIGPTASYDFRSLLHKKNFQLSSLDAMEYRITGSATLAACSE
jgi:hypothetical protein